MKKYREFMGYADYDNCRYFEVIGANGSGLNNCKEYTIYNDELVFVEYTRLTDSELKNLKKEELAVPVPPIKPTMTWDRYRCDGIYQFVAEDFTGKTVVESGFDVTDGKCREVWKKIKKNYPDVTGYKSFCAAYREALKEWEDYCERDQKRYDAFWGRRK